jgi:hypothetical protein
MRYYNLCEGGRALGIAFGFIMLSLLLAGSAGAEASTIDDNSLNLRVYLRRKQHETMSEHMYTGSDDCVSPPI